MSKLQGVWLGEYFVSWFLTPVIGHRERAYIWGWFVCVYTGTDFDVSSICGKYSGGSSTKCSIHGQSASSDKSRLFRCFDKQYHVKERANLDQSIWPGEEIEYPIGKIYQVLL